MCKGVALFELRAAQLSGVPHIPHGTSLAFALFLLRFTNANQSSCGAVFPTERRGFYEHGRSDTASTAPGSQRMADFLTF